MNLIGREPARADALSRTLVAILTAAGRAPGPAPESAALDEESRQRLAALGYLGRGGDTSTHGFDRSKEDPKDLIAFFRKDQHLNKLVEQKKYADARALCDEMLRQRPGFADCHLQMSKIAAAEGNLDAALTAAARRSRSGRRTNGPICSWPRFSESAATSTAPSPTFVRPWPSSPATPTPACGWAARWRKRAPGRGGAPARPGATGQPESATAATQLGYVLAKQGKLAEAVASYRRALALDPGSPEAHAYLGSALASQAQWDEAITHFEIALKARPENAELHDWLGMALREKGRHEEALAHFREAVRLGPGLAMAHFNLGRALKQQGKLDEAVPHYRRALAIDPQMAAAHNSLGSALGAQGQVREAIREFREALRLQPDNEEAHNNLGLALRMTGIAIRRSRSSRPRSPAGRTGRGP